MHVGTLVAQPQHAQDRDSHPQPLVEAEVVDEDKDVARAEHQQGHTALQVQKTWDGLKVY